MPCMQGVDIVMQGIDAMHFGINTLHFGKRVRLHITYCILLLIHGIFFAAYFSWQPITVYRYIDILM